MNKQINHMGLAYGKAERAYVYSGFSQRDHYILCSAGGHKTTPYNTGKIKIGAAYQPRPRYELSATEERLQQALLGDQPSMEDRAERLFMRCLYVIGLVALTVIWFTR